MSLSPEQVSKHGDVTVVTLAERYEALDEQALDAVTNLILDVAATAQPPLVVVDLSQTEYFNSDFVAVLLQGWNGIAKRDGGRFVVCGITSFAADVFSAARLDKVFDIFPTREEAVRALSSD